MNAAVIAAAGITSLAIFLFFIEGDGLAESHVRVRTQILNTARWAIVIALSWVLIPAAFATGPERAATILGLAVLIGAVVLIPVKWFVRLGGREQGWELRRAKVEVALLANKVRRDPGSLPVGRLQAAIGRIDALRTPASEELCDLLVAELEDLRSGSESWNEAGRRSIRIDDLCRRLWPEDMPPPEYDPDEATFRWHLYRTFGRMMELGSIRRTRSSRAAFSRLCHTLDDFRRPDTYRFIDAVKQSADRWLALPCRDEPWIESFEFQALGPDGLAEVKELWARDAVMWGADLDDDDRWAIKQDLVRRAAATSNADEAAPPAELAS